MKRNNVGRVLGAFLLAAVAAASARADAKPAVAGVVISISGAPQVQRAGDKKSRALRLNDLLNEGDVVKTGHGVRVGIAFTGGAEMRINEDSAFTMESGGSESKPTSVFTKLGEAWMNLLNGSKARIQLRTPSAVCAVRGTQGDVTYTGDGVMTALNYEGHVDVTVPGAGTTETVQGQMTRAVGMNAPEPARAMTPKDYRTWHNALKAANLNKSMQVLSTAVDKRKALELNMIGPDGKQKKVKLNFEQK